MTDTRELRTAKVWFDRAYRTAERRGDVASMARAALGMSGLWLAEAARLRLPAPPSDGTGPLRCHQHDTGWVIGRGERTVEVRDSVGMAHLAVLLANPGREIPALDLVAGTPQRPGAVQPVLDDEARRQYRQRLADLPADDPRAAQERAWLLAELAAAAGLGGRTRRFTDPQERARVTVGKAIRRALARIGEADPGLAAELRTTVHTGLRCSYHP